MIISIWTDILFYVSHPLHSTLLHCTGIVFIEVGLSQGAMRKGGSCLKILRCAGDPAEHEDFEPLEVLIYLMVSSFFLKGKLGF